jgi:hypothetical protein
MSKLTTEVDQDAAHLATSVSKYQWIKKNIGVVHGFFGVIANILKKGDGVEQNADKSGLGGGRVQK